ncbi:hypothetical protein scyTo_0006621 [Scyliorhinus torazame]|uniref:NACHT LRR and PYD domain-containing protein n=1 Tax=Scyliorhinus torazame TaxID=75743 RepID=A0A401PIZ7_SCYTO|nr:hypothetical protein [Scyliorhinus torazame]
MVLLRLGELAYECVSKRVIVFNEDHFGQHQLEPSKFISGFMMEILERDDAAKNVVYTFLHLTIQEFLAALAHYLSPKHKNMLELLPWAFKKDDGRFEIFIRFVVGLSASTSSRQLEEILGPLSHHTTCQVIDWLQVNVQAEIKNMDRNAGKRQLLNIFHYLSESQNTALVRKTVGSVERLTFGDSNPQSALRLNPLDCAVLSHVLQLCETMEELNLEKCYIQEEGGQAFGARSPQMQSSEVFTNVGVMEEPIQFSWTEAAQIVERIPGWTTSLCVNSGKKRLLTQPEMYVHNY